MANQRFTVYDVMEAKGAFKTNPANQAAVDGTGAALYTGPVQYPRMLYHPKGEERVTVQAEIIATPLGPKAICEQRELIHQVVNNMAEEEKLIAEGWHRHPATAIAASGKDAPATGATYTIDELKSQIAHLEAQRTALEQQLKTPTPPRPPLKPAA